MRIHHHFLISVFVFLLFSSCENDISKIAFDIDYSSLPVESSREVKMILSDSAKIKIILMAPLLDAYDDKENPYFEMKEGIEVDFYDDSMKIYSKVTADYAIRFPNTGMTEAKGNVVVINEKGEQLNTEELSWNEKKQIIYTDEFVKITTENEIMYGTGMEANQQFSQYKIMNIRGTINVKDE
jgi:LPS export ABC transporter protein LptC